ncbi:hypothetical protein PC9H_008056 [Pleurotus ostreatus]|uniref:BTB domain-containing protein n=1 Tax=Pleurotus ostreatus TaxID=5322 RepID=A0A8H7DS89_PLEOS|nr:uncharacterized protein PC9H_008056 [Pleurotus ostreatus]KAF7428824.1 hypothetical protein PC9H_008056 [Pleurotus ostreatus]KAJ8697053.1 hypothetical protein PTI98_006861 [Pleurotus ostreatus]
MLGDSTFRSLHRHEEYYIQGGDLHFMVEHVQFRVHRYFFDRESLYFRNKLATPASPGAARSGTSDSTAIVLEDVRSIDFARFLWVFYNPKYSLYKTDVDSWTSILDLAFRWQFPEVRKLCVRELERLEMSDVERIHVYQKYEVDRNLLISRYAALCEREEPLSVAEGMRLGMETALTIARAREIARSKPLDGGLRSPTKANVPVATLQDIIRDIFTITPIPDDEITTPTSATATNGNTIPPPPPLANGNVAKKPANGVNGTNGTVTPPLSGSNTPPANANGNANNSASTAPAADVFGGVFMTNDASEKKDGANEGEKAKEADPLAAIVTNVKEGEGSTPSRVSSPAPGDDGRGQANRGRGRGRGRSNN